MKAIKDIYRIGYGPSSSHTIGPMRIVKLYKEVFPESEKYIVNLYGSLAFSGKGHKTDLIIEVSDTGKGIALVDQGRVFERFYRCDHGRDKETGGTGLGLSIVKHIVQYYQGYIDLKVDDFNFNRRHVGKVDFIIPSDDNGILELAEKINQLYQEKINED